ncbi:hypothetical protein Bca4012_102585 [Brassica carinata]
MCKCRSHGTFPLFGLQSSHLNICYYHQDLHRRPLRRARALGFAATARPPTHRGLALARRPADFDFHDHRPAVLIDQHPLWVLDSLVRVSRRVEWEPTGRRPEHADAEARRGACCRPRLRQRRLRGPLGGIYRPIGAAFSNNPTRRQRLRGATGSEHDGLSPSLAPLSRNLGPRVIRLTWGRVEDFGSSSFWTGTTGDITRLEFTTACRGAPGALSSDFGQPRAVTHGDQLPSHILERMGAAICDTQAGVPSARRLGAQLAFKDSMVHGILQFTPSIAFRSFFIDHEPRYPLRESF